MHACIERHVNCMKLMLMEIVQPAQ